MEDMMCCPLEEGDETAQVYNQKTVVGRKDHKCSECKETIPKGTAHDHVKMLFDDSWSEFRVCESCREIGDHFACNNGRVIGELWSDLEQNFFPDMTAGGPCLNGLTPQNKARMFEKRTAWVLSQDEFEPAGFALPPNVTPTQS